MRTKHIDLIFGGNYCAQSVFCHKATTLYYYTITNSDFITLLPLTGPCDPPLPPEFSSIGFLHHPL